MGVQDAVNSQCAGRRLDEVDSLGLGDIEALPVDGEFVASLIDRGGAAVCADAAAAAYKLPALGCGPCAVAQAEQARYQRGAEQRCRTAFTPPARQLRGHHPGLKNCVPDEAVNAVERGVCVHRKLPGARTCGDALPRDGRAHVIDLPFLKTRTKPTSPIQGEKLVFFSEDKKYPSQTGLRPVSSPP